MADLVRFTEKKIGDNNQLQVFINEARPLANVVFPETLPFSDKYCKLGIEVVTVDPNNDKHIYKNESGGYCLHLSKLNEIAKAAKIRTVDSRLLERKVDQNGQVTFISHQVTVEYRTVTGEMIKESYTGKYDYFNDVATKKEGQVKSRRKHAEALAESNALTRAFNKVLPQLPQSFDLKEFSKPFLIPYVIDDKDALIADLPKEDQIAIKKQLALSRLNLTDKIYPQKKDEPEIVDAVVITDEDKRTIPAPEQQEEDFRSKNKIVANEFKESSQKERTEKIMNLVTLTGYKDPNNIAISSARIEKQTVENQIAFLERLLNLQSEMQTTEAPL